MQEVRIEVGTVNDRVAPRAIAAGLEAEPSVRDVDANRINMARQAEEPLLAPDQQHAIHASMRRVARGAALDLHRRMLKNKWAPFFHVALGARLPSALAERRAIRCSMGVVAIGALHRTFRHAMMGRQSELRLNVL